MCRYLRVLRLYITKITRHETEQKQGKSGGLLILFKTCFSLFISSCSEHLKACQDTLYLIMCCINHTHMHNNRTKAFVQIIYSNCSLEDLSLQLALQEVFKVCMCIIETHMIATLAFPWGQATTAPHHFYQSPTWRMSRLAVLAPPGRALDAWLALFSPWTNSWQRRLLILCSFLRLIIHSADSSCYRCSALHPLLITLRG